MKQLLEFIPLILFFAVYKLVGIREAAITLVIATIVQFIILKVKYGKIETPKYNRPTPHNRQWLHALQAMRC